VDRAFVLLPLRDIAPGWRHPVSGLTVAELLESLPQGQRIRRSEA
jgi:2-amino-4-hydroxy-6-hydroxymethyldihydropteridine diphosphokinase